MQAARKIRPGPPERNLEGVTEAEAVEECCLLSYSFEFPIYPRITFQEIVLLKDH